MNPEFLVIRLFTPWLLPKTQLPYKHIQQSIFRYKTEAKMSIINNTTRNNQNWTNQQLIDLSQNLSKAYCPGLNDAKSSKKADSWTTDKFINMSRHLSSAYGVDF